MVVYYILYTINFLLMVVPPVVLGVFIHRRLGARWSLFFLGALTFVLSQVGHIPFNLVVVNGLRLIPTDVSDPRSLVILALFGGVSAGVFEETARLLMYRFVVKDARTWRKGLMFGAGHGAVEAIVLVGLSFAANFVFFALIREGLVEMPAGIGDEATAVIQTQIDTLFSLPYYQTILGGVERIFAVILHLSLSLLVMQVFVRRQWWWWLLAVAWHTTANAVAVYANVTWGPLAAEGLLLVIALLSIGIIFALRTPEPIEPEPPPLPAVKTAAALTPEMNVEGVE